jgi:tRNA-2-methylthio-N6-dimethylallyladenosine synthase
VPYARGREVSRPAKEIISEIRTLVKAGAKEIVLLGQNVNSYTFEKGSSTSEKEVELPFSKTIYFPKLLQLIEKIPGKFWLSFVSSHPKDYSDELIEVIAKSKKICEYIHLPLQAGDDKVLANMNRKYTQKKYLELVRKIKSAFKKNKPGIPFSITTDVIVGFPGETKKQFLQSAVVMKKVGYDMVYFGQFSPRPGTVACKMKDDVSKIEKERREIFLNDILKITNYANNKKYTGKVLEILITTKKGEAYFGHTRTMKNVKIHLTPTLSLSRRGGLVGKIVKAKITKANIWNLEAVTEEKIIKNKK